MQNGDEASRSIILASQALLVKMLITLEPHGIFGSNFVYYYIIFLTGNLEDFPPNATYQVSLKSAHRFQ